MLKTCLSWVISIIIFIVLIAQSFGQEFDNSSFYPLGLSYQWEYSSNDLHLTETIIDTTTISGLLYYGLSEGEDDVRYWIRENNNIVYMLNFTDSTDFVLYDFNSNVGDNWELPARFNCTFGTRITLRSKSDFISTPIGEFYNCYQFEHETTCIDAGIHDTWFAQGVGKIRFVEMFIFGMQDFLLNDYIFEKNYSGDVDGDGIISIQDVMDVVNHILNIQLLDEDSFNRADCNGLPGICDGDEAIDILDIIKIIYLLLGLDECSE